MQPLRVRACVFDAYGTLFDFASAAASCRDAHAASAFGMRVVWCNRYGQRRERLPGTPDREVTTLAELPDMLERKQ